MGSIDRVRLTSGKILKAMRPFVMVGEGGSPIYSGTAIQKKSMK